MGNPMQNGVMELFKLINLQLDILLSFFHRALDNDKQIL